MLALFRNACYLDEWFTECIAAMEFDNNEWVTKRELVNDFAELGFKFGDDLVNGLTQEKRQHFCQLLQASLELFARGKLLRRQPKPHFTPHLQMRGADERSYQPSKFGVWMKGQGSGCRRLYMLLVLLYSHASVTLKKFKWFIGTLSILLTTITLSLKMLEIIESVVAYFVITFFVLILGATIASVSGSDN